MATILYRSANPLLRPRRTKLEIPGWAGEDTARGSGAVEQPWHCIPFTEAARTTVEIIFPHEDDVRVSVADGEVIFGGEFGDDDDPNARRPPFRRFGSNYYMYQALLDVKPPDGLAVRIDPHPRFFTDTTGQVPIAVPALIRPWWPMISFLVFKLPRPGEEHVFRPGEGMAVLTMVPADDTSEVIPMHEGEVAEREQMARQIDDQRPYPEAWVSADGITFDGAYRAMSDAMRKGRRS